MLENSHWWHVPTSPSTFTWLPIVLLLVLHRVRGHPAPLRPLLQVRVLPSIHQHRPNNTSVCVWQCFFGVIERFSISRSAPQAAFSGETPLDGEGVGSTSGLLLLLQSRFTRQKPIYSDTFVGRTAATAPPPSTTGESCAGSRHIRRRWR